MTDSVRYDFGEQWDEFSHRVSDNDLQIAEEAFAALLPRGFDPKGKSFLDIGSGTGMHSVAAARYGFPRVVATDYYDGSVQTTQAMARRCGVMVDAFRDDILNTKITEQFDAVYSWGVLHHTGNLKQAIDNAKALVKPGGLFIISIYLKTPLCWFWKIEKRVYNHLPKIVQSAMGYAFRGLAIALKAVDAKADKERGMDWRVNIRDWLGGFPYESATPADVADMVGSGFSLLASYRTQAGPGILGSGCAEYVFQKA